MFKRKTWTEVNRRFNAPLEGLKSLKGGDPDWQKRVIYGYTTIEMRCNETGELKFYEECGDQR